MPGFNLNIGSSVLKRETKPYDEVLSQLRRNGWTQTGSLGDSVRYFENSGFSITVVDGPMATLIMPSGPVRGRVFGNSGLMANQTSVLGMGSDSSEKERENQNKQASNKVQQIT